MESLFVVNPRGKRKGKMPAGLRRYWASRRRQKNPRRRKHRARAANPVRRRKRRANPVRSHRRKRRANPVRSHRRKRRANPVYFHRRKRRHNPFSIGSVKGMLMPAAYGAGGAIATAIAYGYIAPSLPSALTTGYAPILVKAAAAIGLGMLIGKFMSRQDGQYATIGGLTVVLVGAVTPLISQAAPTLPGLSGLAGYGDYIPYRAGVGAYSASLQRQATSRLGRLGFVSPAPRVGMGAYMGRGAPTMGDLSGSGFNGLNDGM